MTAKESNCKEKIKQIKNHLTYLSKVNTRNRAQMEKTKDYWWERLFHYEQQLKTENQKSIL